MINVLDISNKLKDREIRELILELLNDLTPEERITLLYEYYETYSFNIDFIDIKRNQK
jgi:DNA-directed RNA polymerase specialized sigma24 family protein